MLPELSLDVPAARRAARRRRLPQGAVGWVLPLALLGAIELAAALGWSGSRALPPPSEVLRALAGLGGRGLAAHVLASSARVIAGFALGSLLALAVGAAVGLSARVSAWVDPGLQALRVIPSLAWVPLLLLWLGIDELPKLVLVAIGAFFQVYLGVVSGLRGVDGRLVEFGRVHGFTRGMLLRHVMLPAALPSVLTGLRSGLGLAWMFMVAAELIAASNGLGYLLTDGRETGRADLVLAAILLLALLGHLSDGAMRALERRLLAWRDAAEPGR